jgi:hypothetical protein
MEMIWEARTVASAAPAAIASLSAIVSSHCCSTRSLWQLIDMMFVSALRRCRCSLLF